MAVSKTDVTVYSQINCLTYCLLPRGSQFSAEIPGRTDSPLKRAFHGMLVGEDLQMFNSILYQHNRLHPVFRSAKTGMCNLSILEHNYVCFQCYVNTLHIRYLLCRYASQIFY